MLPIISEYWIDCKGNRFCKISYDSITFKISRIYVSEKPLIIRFVKELNYDNKSKHYCYLLKSINPIYSRRTYIGYTIDPFRRIRQHNGEIVGGAKRTQKARPWKIICYISGFTTQRIALQFEWVNNHPKIKRWGINGRLTTLAETLTMKRWTSNSPLSSSMFFTIHWCLT